MAGGRAVGSFEEGCKCPFACSSSAACVYALLQLSAAAEREQEAATELLQAQAERQHEARQVGNLDCAAGLAPTASAPG